MNPVVVTDATFNQEVLKADKLTLVDFWAEWCAPCRAVSPLVEEIAKEYDGKLKVGKMNVDENPTTPQNYGVMSIPTLILFKDGKPVNTLIGVQPKETMKKVIDESL